MISGRRVGDASDVRVSLSPTKRTTADRRHTPSRANGDGAGRLQEPSHDASGMNYPQRRYQIFLKSSGGPIDVYLVSDPQQPVRNDDALVQPSVQVPNDSKLLPPPPTDSTGDKNNSASNAHPNNPEGNTSTSVSVNSNNDNVIASANAAAATMAAPMLKLEPAQQDPEYYFNLEKHEGISDFYKTEDDFHLHTHPPPPPQL